MITDNHPKEDDNHQHDNNQLHDNHQRDNHLQATSMITISQSSMLVAKSTMTREE